MCFSLGDGGLFSTALIARRVCSHPAQSASSCGPFSWWRGRPCDKGAVGPFGSVPTAARSGTEHDVPVFELVIPRADEPKICPRCRRYRNGAKSKILTRVSMALAVSGGSDYVPANIYPSATIPIVLGPLLLTCLAV